MKKRSTWGVLIIVPDFYCTFISVPKRPRVASLEFELKFTQMAPGGQPQMPLVLGSNPGEATLDRFGTDTNVQQL